MQSKGILMVIFGGEGAGKTTNGERAAKKFGDRVFYTREPGGSPLAEAGRDFFISPLMQAADPIVRTLYAFALRADHIIQTITPALEAGKLVICDRFDVDTFAYQIRAEGGKRYEPFFWKLREEVLGRIRPNLYVHFDVDPGEGRIRKLNQGASHLNAYEEKSLEFHHAVNEGYKEFMKQPNSLCHRIDANKGPDEVWEKFREIVEGQLNFLT